ncbi:hypothetical protein MKW92_003759, partial [Papaver armeniacum]
MLLPLLLLLFLHIIISILSSAESSVIEQTKPGCESKCGNITIPYPFGFGSSCSYNERDAGNLYFIECNTTNNPPKPFIRLSNSKLEVLSISGTEVRVKSPAIATKCYDPKTLQLVIDTPGYIMDLRGTPFTFSYTKNSFIGIGCGLDLILDYGRGALSSCKSSADVIEGSCTGSNGCSKIPMEKNLKLIKGRVKFYFGNAIRVNFSQCAFGFLVEIGEYKFQATDLLRDGRLTNHDMVLPVVLDWAIEEQSCEVGQTEASTNACKDNSFCTEAVNNPGYVCNCSKGYEGNPYLGCKDVNECEDKSNNPCNGNICTNTNGGYNCSTCPEERKSSSGCITVDNEAVPLTKKEGFPVTTVAI